MSEDPIKERSIRSSTARRGARRGLRRSKTLAVRKLTRHELEQSESILNSLEEFRPVTRADCRKAQRPCPWVSCKYHLYLDIVPQSGSIKLNFPDLEVWEMAETCALDVADRGGITLEDVGILLNLTRERIRQVERSGVEKMQQILGDGPVDDDDEEECYFDEFGDDEDDLFAE